MTEPARVGASTSFPVEIGVIKQHLAIDDDDRDELLQLYLAAAVEKIEVLSGRAISASDWRWSLDGFASGDIVLPFGPAVSGVEISYFDADDALQTLSSDTYQVDLSQIETRLRPLNEWPMVSDRLASVTVTWSAAAETCPPTLKQAVLMLVDYWFANRNGTAGGVDADIPKAVRELVATVRRFRG